MKPGQESPDEPMSAEFGSSTETVFITLVDGHKCVLDPMYRSHASGRQNPTEGFLSATRLEANLTTSIDNKREWARKVHAHCACRRKAFEWLH